MATPLLAKLMLAAQKALLLPVLSHAKEPAMHRWAPAVLEVALTAMALEPAQRQAQREALFRKPAGLTETCVAILQRVPQVLSPAGARL
jgi:hypothetical protein